MSDPAADPNRSSNPFADAPLPAGERLQSAADPLNPYAAPVGVDEYRVQTGPGPGIWRNGDLIVIHQSLDLPRRCIWTNEPSERRLTLALTYSTWLGLRNWSIHFDYSFSRTALRQVMKIGLTSGLVALGSFLALMGLFVIENTEIVQFTWLATLCVIVAPLLVISLLVACGLVWKQLQPPLSLIHQEQGYFCLRGAKEPFLQSLPNWPGLHR